MPKKIKKKKTKNTKGPKKNYINLVYVTLSLFALGLTAFNLILSSKSSTQVLGTQIIRTYSPTLTQEAQYWEKIISKFPTYRDGYLELYDIYTKMGEEQKALNFYQTAKNLDPNNLSF